MGKGKKEEGENGGRGTGGFIRERRGKGEKMKGAWFDR